MTGTTTHDHRWTMEAAEVRTDEQGRKRAHWICCGEWARGLWAEQPEAIEEDRIRMEATAEEWAIRWNRLRSLDIRMRRHRTRPRLV